MQLARRRRPDGDAFVRTRARTARFSRVVRDFAARLRNPYMRAGASRRLPNASRDARLTPGFRRLRCAAMPEPVRRRAAARMPARQPRRHVTAAAPASPAVAAPFTST
ncbi:hypothetical protein A8H40_25915 [Burkholderia multivorans]|nr:hypothetical protein A8H40_25915 [Burkholderia multivorans]EEE13299.1 hypothetical protein BURMUCGD2M_1399 [Burkholderia multivorans CGD2M]